MRGRNSDKWIQSYYDTNAILRITTASLCFVLLLLNNLLLKNYCRSLTLPTTQNQWNITSAITPEPLFRHKKAMKWRSIT